MNRSRDGFSLVELAILLLIFGGLAAASTMLGSKWIEGEEVQTTKKNLQTLEQAIDAYARTNQRLPCPAPEGLASDHADYGRDTSTPNGLCSTATLTSGEAVKGVVPFKTLGIGKALAHDPWGNRYVYYVDRRITKEDSMSKEYPVNNTVIGDIVIEDLGGGQRTNKAVYALVSMGKHDHGAMSREGVAQTRSGSSSKEQENADVNAAGASTSPDKVLVQGLSSEMSDGSEFDDVVSYKLRSQIAASEINRIQNCTAQAVNWTVTTSTCGGSVAELADGESVVVSDTSGGVTGSVIVTCNSGELVQNNLSCSGTPLNCSGTVNWTVDAACSANAAATLHGATRAVTNSTAGRSGTATFICDDGTFTLSPTPSAVCGNNCPANTANWTVGGKNCTAAHGVINHASSTTATDSAPVDTGNVSLTCTNGLISQSGAACSTTGCGAATLSWGSCTANVGGPQSNGFSTSLTNTAAGYTGTATATCTMGAWGLSGTSCNQNCAAQALNWTVSGQNCSQSVGGAVHGTVSTVTDAVQNSTGSITATCNNGTWNTSSPSCATNCTGTAWGTVSHGASVTAWNVGASCGGCASQTRTCNQGTLSGSYGFTSCNNVGTCAACWGPSGWVGHGGWTYAYWAWSVPCGGTCWGEWRYCNNGSLSGSYGASSCSVGSCGSSCPGWTVNQRCDWSGTQVVLAYWIDQATCLASCRSLNAYGCCELNNIFIPGGCSFYYGGGGVAYSSHGGDWASVCYP